MVGFYAIAESNQEIRVDLDTELGGMCSCDLRVNEMQSNLDPRLSRRSVVLKGRRCVSSNHNFETHPNGVSGAVLDVLAHPLGTTMGSSLSKADLDAEKLPPPAFRVPNKALAIAGVLIHDWAHRKVPELSRNVDNASKI